LKDRRFAQEEYAYSPRVDEGRRSHSQGAREAKGWRREDCKDVEANARRNGSEGAYHRCVFKHSIMVQALKATAWILLLALFIFTVGPLGLRPTFGYPNAERLLALAVLGFAFSLAYPRRFLVVLTLLVGALCCFEYLQHFVNYRHGTAHDVAIKLAGAVAGVSGGLVVSKLVDDIRSG
jgi:glycopeptide antibiotics resistance protein